jgi:uncharacterized membrane protein
MIILGDFDIAIPVPSLREILIGIGAIVLILIALAFFLVKKFK